MRFLVDECTGTKVASWLKEITSLVGWAKLIFYFIKCLKILLPTLQGITFPRNHLS
jgi:hypothetical protein